jgi:iron(III) transport system substrate-binding protein
MRILSPLTRHRLIVSLIGCSLLVLTGCLQEQPNEVVVYAALDAEFSEPILETYEAESGRTVRPNFDVESTKTVGLVTRIIGEKDRPRCDVFWNNEILHTLRLEELGLLQSYASPAAESFPENYRSPDGYWYGLAARARVLIVNTEQVPPEQRPTSIRDLADPQWKDQVGIAKPLFGTTATHASVLFDRWGAEQAKAFFRKLKENVRVMSGNKQVALSVARGELAFGLTDTDDAIIEIEQGHSVTIVYPDQGEGEMGTLFIPNTICILKDCPHPAAARDLVDYLLQPQVERALAAGPSAQFPVSRQVDERSRAAPEKPVRWMEVDFRAAADRWDEASTFLRDLFATAE